MQSRYKIISTWLKLHNMLLWAGASSWPDKKLFLLFFLVHDFEAGLLFSCINSPEIISSTRIIFITFFFFPHFNTACNMSVLQIKDWWLRYVYSHMRRAYWKKYFQVHFCDTLSRWPFIQFCIAFYHFRFQEKLNIIVNCCVYKYYTGIWQVHINNCAICLFIF